MCETSFHLFRCFCDIKGSKEYKNIGLDQTVEEIKIQTKQGRYKNRDNKFDQFHDDGRPKYVSE